MLVITAGSLMHMLIAIGLLFTVYAARGELVERPGAEIAVQDGGPADEAGLQSGDIVLSVDGVTVDGSEELGEAVRTNAPGDVIPIVVERDGQQLAIDVGLGTNTDEASPTFGAAYLGVGSRTAVGWEEMSLGEAATSSVADLFPSAWESTKGVVQVLNPVNIWDQLTNESADPATRPTTVVGVTQFSGSWGDQFGFYGVLLLLASLNVFVGVFNMFPLLPLDGGHAAIATYERLRERNGRRYFADVSKLLPFAMGVIAVLLVLFMSGLYLDITQPLR
jgi:membrane-associated protease RseP (regulator of RpoE activity)